MEGAIAEVAHAVDTERLVYIEPFAVTEQINGVACYGFLLVLPPPHLHRALKVCLDLNSVHSQIELILQLPIH